MPARTGCPARLWFRILEEERSISGLGLHLLDAKVGLFYSARWIELQLGFSRHSSGICSRQRHCNSAFTSLIAKSSSLLVSSSVQGGLRSRNCSRHRRSRPLNRSAPRRLQSGTDWCFKRVFSSKTSCLSSVSACIPTKLLRRTSSPYATRRAAAARGLAWRLEKRNMN